MRRRALLLAGAALAARPAAAETGPRLARRNDTVIEYTDRGAGPAIVMIASLGRAAEDFDDLGARLVAQGFRVICPEPRRIGSSEGPALANPTLHDLAADVALVIEDAKAAPAVVLGHAYGNTVARTLAADRPDLIRGVILVAASGRAPFSREISEAIAKSSDLSIPDAERVGHLARGYFAPGHDASVWLPGWHPEAQALQYQAFRATKLDDYIAAGGRVPILDIQGDHDVIIPREYSEDLHRELGDRVTVVVIPDAGHAMLPEQPEAITAAITAWMRRL
jgi:pimeloyl-ACP methyl ester carboxylesterase